MINQNKEHGIWEQIKTIKSKSKANPYDSLPILLNDKDNKNELMIEIKNLTCKFKTLKGYNVVFENVSFNLYEGENIAFLGPNGAGKTVMVEMLSGTRKQNAGKIIYHFNHKKNNPYEHLGVQFQDFEFPTGLTVKDMIDFIIKLNNIENIDIEEFNDILETFQLKHILKNKVSKLSGGQKQRLNVTLALLNKPKILFLDEFTTGLDIAIKNDIQNFIVKYCNKNKTSLVLVSHDIDSINGMTNRVIILAEQEIKIDLKKDEIVEQFGSVAKLLKKYIVY